MARDRDDEDDDRPRRRDRDDRDDDDRPRRDRSEGEALGPLDKTFRDTNIIVLVLFGLCCGWIAAILSLVCVFTAKDPKAKSNAIIVLVCGIIMGIINVVAYVMNPANQ